MHCPLYPRTPQSRPIPHALSRDSAPHYHSPHGRPSHPFPLARVPAVHRHPHRPAYPHLHLSLARDLPHHRLRSLLRRRRPRPHPHPQTSTLPSTSPPLSSTPSSPEQTSPQASPAPSKAKSPSPSTTIPPGSSNASTPLPTRTFHSSKSPQARKNCRISAGTRIGSCLRLMQRSTSPRIWQTSFRRFIGPWKQS